MKKLAKNYLYAVLLIFGATTMLTSCDEKAMEDFVESVNLVGTWRCSETVHSSVSSSDVRPFFTGMMTFDANHNFHDSYGEHGSWSLRDRTLTLHYDNWRIGTVKLLVQDGYTLDKMVLTTTIDLGYGRSCFSTVTLRNAR